jgi:type III secretion protein R
MEAASPLFIGFLASFYLLAAITLTSFIKVTMVLLILRNAIGIQQVPSTMIIMALAMFISAFISMPVFSESAAIVAESSLDFETVEQMLTTLNAMVRPFQTFMAANIDPDHLNFFVEVGNEIWKDSNLKATPDTFLVQVPAFMISELTRGFQIGFLLYLPFIAIDLAITTVLMALGMQQVQPSLIAAPFKLLLFIFVNGLEKLIEGLMMSYNYA